MRELQDYFCDYTQSKQLKNLGFKEQCLAYHHDIIIGLKPIDHNFKTFRGLSEQCVASPLRSQALDFFRDLGYTFNSCITANDNKFAYDCLNRFGDYFDESFDLPHEPESALISLLIELEKEARNGK